VAVERVQALAQLVLALALAPVLKAGGGAVLRHMN